MALWSDTSPFCGRLTAILPCHLFLKALYLQPARPYETSHGFLSFSCPGLPVPGIVGIPGRLPVKSPLSWLWLPPVWPTADLWEEHTWVPQSVKAMVASNQPPQSLSSGTWQQLLYFPQEHLALKFHSRGHWSCPPRNLTLQYSCPQAAPRPGGPPYWCEVRENSCPIR